MPDHHPAPDRAAATTAALGEAQVLTGVALDALDTLEYDWGAVRNLLEQNHDLRRFLADPGVQSAGKREALERLLVDRVHPAVLHAIRLLADAGRIEDLPALAVAFFEALARRRHECWGDLVAARAPGPERVQAIEQELTRIVGTPVRLRVRVQPALTAGMRVRVGDLVFDHTLDRRLESWRRALLSA